MAAAGKDPLQVLGTNLDRLLAGFLQGRLKNRWRRLRSRRVDKDRRSGKEGDQAGLGGVLDVGASLENA
jgi:hypothetical protein